MGAKTLFLFLGLVAILGLIYLGSSRFSSDKNVVGNAVQSGKNSFAASGKVLGAEVIKGALSGVDNLVAKTEDTIKNGAANLIKNVSQSATNQVTQAILGSSTPVSLQVQKSSLAAASICPSFSKNQNISYVIKFASSSASQDYAVDWGDGHATSGATTAKEISLSHIYIKTGSYTAVFKAGSLQAQKDICVE